MFSKSYEKMIKIRNLQKNVRIFMDILKFQIENILMEAIDNAMLMFVLLYEFSVKTRLTVYRRLDIFLLGE